MAIKRGEIYWVFIKQSAEGSEQKKDRPYVIVSRDEVNLLGHNVVGVPLTTNLKKMGGHRLQLPTAYMIPNPACKRPLKDSVALTDHIRVLDINRLEQPKMGDLTQTAIGGMEIALSFIFNIQ